MSCTGLNNYPCHFEVYLRYPILYDNRRNVNDNDNNNYNSSNENCTPVQ